MNAMTPLEMLRAALQRLLDEEGDGWQMGQHLVISVGLERVTTDGVEGTAWCFWPENQPDWITNGLLDAAIEQRLTIDN